MQDNVDGTPGRPRRLEIAAGLGVVLLWIAVWAPRLDGPIDLRWDASTYFVLGTSLAEGKGYRLLNEPMPMLKRARVDGYAAFREDSAFQVVPLDLRPVATTHLEMA